MAGGLLLGRLIPDLNDGLERIKVDTVSLPIAIGLLAMMYPVLAKVRYGHLGDELADRRTLALSLVLNWLVGRSGAQCRSSPRSNGRRDSGPRQSRCLPWPAQGRSQCGGGGTCAGRGSDAGWR